MSLSRKAKHVRSYIQKPLPCDFPHVKCPIDVDLMESKLLKAGRREERMLRGHLSR